MFIYYVLIKLNIKWINNINKCNTICKRKILINMKKLVNWLNLKKIQFCEKLTFSIFII